MGKTKIDWCDRVWNPTTGCTKVSQGCKNCYAERIANRFWKDRWFSDVRYHSDRLDEPSHWRNPQRVFVDSMSDLFHPDIPFGFIMAIFYAMGTYHRHTYLVLTKRPDRMHAFFHYWEDVFIPEAKQNGFPFFKPPLRNVWLGVSVEDQDTADKRIPLLLHTPAAKMFVSYEPALGPIDLQLYDSIIDQGEQCYKADLLDWFICGCESGPGARSMDMDWIRNVADQCVNAGVPFFFKQAMINGRLVHMPELDGQVWDQFPEG